MVKSVSIQKVLDNQCDNFAFKTVRIKKVEIIGIYKNDANMDILSNDCFENNYVGIISLLSEDNVLYSLHLLFTSDVPFPDNVIVQITSISFFGEKIIGSGCDIKSLVRMHKMNNTEDLYFYMEASNVPSENLYYKYKFEFNINDTLTISDFINAILNDPKKIPDLKTLRSDRMYKLFKISYFHSCDKNKLSIEHIINKKGGRFYVSVLLDNTDRSICKDNYNTIRFMFYFDLDILNIPLFAKIKLKSDIKSYMKKNKDKSISIDEFTEKLFEERNEDIITFRTDDDHKVTYKSPIDVEYTMELNDVMVIENRKDDNGILLYDALNKENISTELLKAIYETFFGVAIENDL